MQKTWEQLRVKNIIPDKLLIREKVLAGIRAFFVKNNYHEVEVPLLVQSLIPESYLEIFETQLNIKNSGKKRAFLTPSPEIHLKKLLVAGIGNCFTITKSFRNTESFSQRHSPEFTLLEWYHIDADYRGIMEETENLFWFLHQKLSPKGKSFVYQGNHIDLSPPWERISMAEAFSRYAHIELSKNLDIISMRKSADEKGYAVMPENTWEELFNQIYLNEVEPKLGIGKPTIIYDFPSQVAALSKKKKEDPRYAERFEVYIGGLELGDAYTELTDWKEQLNRFDSEQELRKKNNMNGYPQDNDFIEALKCGLPPCAGMALGVDRVCMLFANAKDISETLFFPPNELWSV